MSTATSNSEADILTRMLAPSESSLSAEAARSILRLKMTEQDLHRMQLLSAKASEGRLTDDEQAEVDSYERVGCLLGILQSKARLSLERAASAE